jgi:hypothetical protein
MDLGWRFLILSEVFQNPLDDIPVLHLCTYGLWLLWVALWSLILDDVGRWGFRRCYRY